MTGTTDRAALTLQHEIIETAKDSFKTRPDGMAFVQHLEIAARAGVTGTNYTFRTFAGRAGWVIEILDARDVGEEPAGLL